MWHRMIRAVSFLALLAGSTLASEFEDSLRRDYAMAVNYPRAVTTLGAFFDNALGGVRASQVPSFQPIPLFPPCLSAHRDGTASMANVDGLASYQITESNDPSRPFEVDGDTFVRLSGPSITQTNLRPRSTIFARASTVE